MKPSYELTCIAAVEASYSYTSVADLAVATLTMV